MADIPPRETYQEIKKRLEQEQARDQRLELVLSLVFFASLTAVTVAVLLF